MNNGNFNGYDPNNRNQNGYSQGLMGSYDPNANAPYQANHYQDNSSTQGYNPYDGGTYGNPNPNGYNAYQQPQNGYNAQFQGGYSQNPGFNAAPAGVNAGAAAGTGTMTLADYSKKIFLWMGAGLGLTFFVALGLILYLTSGSVLDLYLKFTNMLPVFYGGIIVELVLAFVLSLFVKKLPYGASLGLFIAYSIVSGVTFTPILCVYDAGSAIFAFAAAAVLFVSFAIYGIVTKRDLSKLGPLLMIGLIVLILFSVIGIFVHMSWASIIIALIGIAIFIGLTAYDTQKIKASYNAYSGNDEMLKKLSVNLALQLYLDFVNLFIYILKLMGKARR